MIRSAVYSDLEFIFKCIIESEKSGSNIFPYTAILGISEFEFKSGLKEIFEEEIPNQPWYLDHWIIYELDGCPAAGLCYWNEESGMSGSEMLKSQMLSFQFSEQWKSNSINLQKVSNMSIPRKKDYIQLEHLFTHTDFRGMGLMKKLINWVINSNKSRDTIQNLEIQLLKGNSAALSLYEYMGFSVESTKCEPEVERLTLLSSGCKVQMIKQNG